MNASFCRASCCFAMFAALTLPAAAQQFFWVHREGALPSKVAEFEKTTREMVAFATANRDVMPTFSFETWVSPDFAYTYVTPIGESLGGGDLFAKEFAAVGAKLPAQTLDLWHRSGDTAAWWDDSIFLLRGDLSYLPENGRLQPEEHKFDQMDFYFIKPGYAVDAEEIAVQIKALYEKKKMVNGYAVLQAITGENPLYLVRSFAKDPADYWTNRQKDLELLGPEGKALFDKVFALTRKFDSEQFFLRPDLSLAPPAKK
jgi:hypothetical protein